MRALSKLVVVQEYMAPRYCIKCGAGLEYQDELERGKNNIYYQVLICRNCGKKYVVRKIKEVIEEVEDENDKV